MKKDGFSFPGSDSTGGWLWLIQNVLNYNQITCKHENCECFWNPDFVNYLLNLEIQIS